MNNKSILKNLKKIGVCLGVMGLGLTLSLAGNPLSVANAKRRVRTHRVYHAHHYYRFAYNHREYQAYLKAVRRFKADNQHIRKTLHYNRRSNQYRHGVRDALNNLFDYRLRNNPDYARAYKSAVRMNDAAARIPDNRHDLNRIYNALKNSGPGTAPALNQIKMEAHLGTL